MRWFRVLGPYRVLVQGLARSAVAASVSGADVNKNTVPSFLPSCPPSFLTSFLPSLLPFFLPALPPYFLPSFLPSLPPSFLPILPGCCFLPCFLPSWSPETQKIQKKTQKHKKRTPAPYFGVPSMRNPLILGLYYVGSILPYIYI